jgi:Xaa-Pro dipeptidase
LNSLPERCSKILNQEYPTFSDAEFARRRKAFEAAMEHRGVRHVIIRSALKAGPSIQWLTGWLVTAEAVIVYSIGENLKLYIQHTRRSPAGSSTIAT